MEGGWGGGCEIKGKNSSEITKLFIFPALRLWAFEASTLMYLDILGPSVTEATPAPQRHVGSISRGCPRSLLKWVLVVFTRLRVGNVCTVLAGPLPGVGWGGVGVLSSLTSLFIWEPEWRFLWLLLSVLCRPKAFVPEGRVGLAHILPTARRAHLARPLVHLAFGDAFGPAEPLLGPSSSRGLVRITGQNSGLQMLVLLGAFATIMGKRILLILKTTLLPHVTGGDTVVQSD